MLLHHRFYCSFSRWSCQLSCCMSWSIQYQYPRHAGCPGIIGIMHKINDFYANKALSTGLVTYTQSANSCHSFQKSMRSSWRDSSIFFLCWRGCIFVWRKDRHVLVGGYCSSQLGFLIPHGGIKEVSKQAHFTRGEVGITFDAKKCQSINVRCQGIKKMMPRHLLLQL